MSLSNSQWQMVATYVRNSVVAQFDPAFVNADPKLDALTTLKQPHQGFYIGLDTASGEKISRDGFLKEGQTSIYDSINMVIPSVVNSIKSKHLGLSDVQTGIFHFTLVINHHYLKDPLGWDENSDGVYFMWGQDYRGLFLPYEIKKMKVSKVEILDRLCASVNLISNLWQLPEGMIWKLVCSSHDS